MKRVYAFPFNPARQDPRTALSAGQRALLRLFDRFGPASKAPNGWVMGGVFYRDATLRHLMRLGLVDEEWRDGRHRAGLSPTGRTVLAILARPRPPAGDLFASVRRP